MLIQSSVNSFGSVAMAGNTAAANIEGFVYNSMNAVHQTALSFTSQNVGAKKYKRIGKILTQCLLIVSAIGLTMGIGAYALGKPLLHIYSSDPEVIQYGLALMQVICVTYFRCGIMAVSYTHLDVYKRQVEIRFFKVFLISMAARSKNHMTII